jgi:hypothetical protein
MKDKQRRLERIRAAKEELEAEAKAAAEAKPAPYYRGGRKPKHPTGPQASAQRNFTDPESRIMKGKDGFIQCYNAQIPIDITRKGS